MHILQMCLFVYVNDCIGVSGCSVRESLSAQVVNNVELASVKRHI